MLASDLSLSVSKPGTVQRLGSTRQAFLGVPTLTQTLVYGTEIRRRLRTSNSHKYLLLTEPQAVPKLHEAIG